MVAWQLEEMLYWDLVLETPTWKVMATLCDVQMERKKSVDGDEEVADT